MVDHESALATTDRAASPLLLHDPLVLPDGDAVLLPEVVGPVVSRETGFALPLLERRWCSALSADECCSSVWLTAASRCISTDACEPEVPASGRDINAILAGEEGRCALVFDVAPDEFCHNIGLNYVSCSPFRVPIARLAAAQAAIKQKQAKK